MLCQSCGTENREGRKFCAECGKPLAVVCAACGAGNEPGERFCGECGAALGEPAPAPRGAPASERRLVSVLFADLVGFTALSEARDAEEVRELLSRYFESCRRIISLYGGTVEKFIGDAVMAVWGTPTATEDDAERAVRAALDLIAAVSALGQEVGAEELRARAGVLTGEAAVTIGAEGEGMVAGDLVNTASRIQAASEPGSVLVGDSTRRATDSTIVYEEAGSFELKGKEAPVTLWEARRVVSGLRGSLKSERLEAPFVGRDRELRQIKDLFHAAAGERKAHLVSVTGIAGIGKSRLAWEFYKYFDGIAETVYWHRGRCLPYGEGVTYWALADMVRMRCRISEDEDPGQATEKLRATLAEHILDPAERAFVEPRLGQLLGVADHEARDRQDLFAAWRLFFERLAEAYPTVLAFEDMQWADESLLDFVEYLLDWSRNHPLFVVTLARPELLEKRPTWGAGQRSFTSLYLEPLSQEAMEALLAGLVPGLPEPLRDQILARAEGVPLYAVETVRMLLDRGLLVQEGATYGVAGAVDALEVPETLHALIAARLDDLSAEERRLLEDGSVLGKTFTKDALAAVSGLGADQLEPLLQSLVRKEVLSLQADPRSPEHGQYGFLQDLVRHVAYGTLSKRDRRGRHLAAASYLETAFAREPDEVIEVIASHYVDAYEAMPEAEDAEALKQHAVDVLARAGERAASLAAAGEARRYFEQAARLAAEATKRAALLTRAGEMASRSGDAEEARRLVEEAISLSESYGDARGAAAAATILGVVSGFTGQREKAVAEMERAFAVISEDPPSEELAMLAARLALNHWFLGDLELSDQRAELALDIAEEYGYHEALNSAFRAKGAIAFSKGHAEEARAYNEHALGHALEHDFPWAASTCYFILSDLEFRRDRYEAALDYLADSIALARKFGSRPFEWAGLAEMTYPLYMLGRWDEALGMLEDPSEEQTRSGGVLLSLLDGLMEIYLGRGQIEDARRIFSLFGHLEGSPDVQDRSTYLAARASLNRADGRFTEALADADDAIEAASTLGYAQQGAKQAVVAGLEAAVALGDSAKVDVLISFMEQGPPGRGAPFYEGQAVRFRARVGGDESGYERAGRVFREADLPFWLAVVQLEHAELLLENGRPDDVAPLLEEARETFERLRATPWLERLAQAVPEREAVSGA
ncbi:MAG TPA: adenylate/guanylate cyclase domain-containing protein [Gaiellaceae bacterium]|nr:adenylate/guanylate cyclase domain-containing protein [Gaiellaceae bacterium]